MDDRTSPVPGWESNCECRQRRSDLKAAATETGLHEESDEEDEKAQKEYEETMNDEAIYGLRPNGSPTA